MKRSALRRIASAVVTATQEKLPLEIRELARAVPVLLEDGPDDSVQADGLPADLLGLFSGTPHGEEIAQAAPEPPHIILYLNNLWDYAEEDEPVFRDEVRLTYLHELGHYLGWNEDQLAARGLD